jgi:putative membrane protein
MKKNTPYLGVITALCTFIFAFLIWFIYFKPTQITNISFVSQLPLLNCILNTASSICLVLGVRAIIKKREKCHRNFMLSALVFSGLFLISYLFYHHYHGDTPFLAEGVIRPIYFTVLISHIGLTFFALPLILTTFFFALSSQFTLHKKVARWTFPIWLYVSVTGVIIYILQRIFNGDAYAMTSLLF